MSAGTDLAGVVGGLRGFTVMSTHDEEPEPGLVAPRTLARCHRGCG